MLPKGEEEAGPGEAGELRGQSARKPPLLIELQGGQQPDLLGERLRRERQGQKHLLQIAPAFGLEGSVAPMGSRILIGFDGSCVLCYGIYTVSVQPEAVSHQRIADC